MSAANDAFGVALLGALGIDHTDVESFEISVVAGLPPWMEIRRGIRLDDPARLVHQVEHFEVVPR